MIPAAIETKAVTIAYGSCVLTWSKFEQPLPFDESIVQSVIGEQWSPKILPERPQAITSGRKEELSEG